MTDTFSFISQNVLAFNASAGTPSFTTTTASATLLATGGTDGTIVRHMRVVNNTTSTVKFRMWIAVNGSGATLNSTDNVQPPAEISDGGWSEFEGTIILDSGDALYGMADTSAALTCTVYGLDMAP